MNDIYRELILSHYKNPQNFGSLSESNASYEKDNPFCGDRIKMELLVDDNTGIIKKIAFSGEGCALSIASSSLLTVTARGKKIEDLLKMKKNDIVDLLGVNLTPVRIKCAVLPLEVIQKALYNYGKKKK